MKIGDLTDPIPDASAWIRKKTMHFEIRQGAVITRSDVAKALYRKTDLIGVITPSHNMNDIVDLRLVFPGTQKGLFRIFGEFLAEGLVDNRFKRFFEFSELQIRNNHAYPQKWS